MRFETMRKVALAGTLGLLVGFTGACDDLAVENLNAPDRDRALATPSDVASLIGGAYRSYFFVMQGFSESGDAMASHSDHISSSWGNAGMKDFGNEPRIPINNQPSYSYAYAVEDPWYNLYGAIVAASDGLRAMENVPEVGNELGAMERAFGKFMQGVSLSYLGLQYDKGFVVDETTDLSVDQEFVDYQSMSDAGLARMQAAVDIANSNSFSLPANWINGRSLSSAALARYIHGLMARHMASVPRTPDEASSVDWDAVIDHVDNGIQSDFTVQGESDFSWWSGIKTFGGTYEGFTRADYRRIGPAETGDRYEQWEATPPEQRSEFDFDTPDQRIVNGGLGEMLAQGAYIWNAGTSPFPSARGTYYYSKYADGRYWADQYNAYPGTFDGPILMMSKTEMDLLKAEAYIMKDQPAQAVPLINATRTTNGGLPPVDAGGTTQGPGDCVPQLADGSCGDLMEALKHEKRLELYQVSAGQPYFDARRWGDLLTGSALQWPVPGAELQILQQEIYTYGGGGESSAPSTAPLPGPNADRETLLERVKFSLDGLLRQQESFSERPDRTKQ